MRSKGLPLVYCQEVLPDVLHSVRSLLCTATTCTPHERLFGWARRSTNGNSLPSWLTTPGPVLLKRHVRNSKIDPLVEEVDLMDANQRLPLNIGPYRGALCAHGLCGRRRQWKLHWPHFMATWIRGTVTKEAWLIRLHCHLNQRVSLRPNGRQATLLLTVRQRNHVMLKTSRPLMLQHIQTNALFYADLRENGVLLIDLATINFSMLVDTPREGWM